MVAILQFQKEQALPALFLQAELAQTT